MSPARARLVLEYADESSARTVHGSLAPDDDAFCRTRLEGRALVAELQAADAKSLLRAVDDLLACVSVAEDVIKTP